MNKIITDYIEAVCDLIREPVLRDATRRKLATQVVSRYNEARQIGQDEDTAAQTAVNSMATPGRLAQSILVENNRRRGVGSLILFVLASIAFFVFLAFLTHGEIVRSFNIFGVLAVIVLACVIALAMSIRELTLRKFLVSMELGSAVSGIVYSIYIMVAAVARVTTVTGVRNNLGNVMLAWVYGVLLFAVVHFIDKFIVSTKKDFVEEVILSQGRFQ
jgi:hypothetical protein